MTKKEKKNNIFKKGFLYLFLALVFIVLYSAYVETKMLKIKEYKIVNSKLTDSYHGLKIVHFSDLHYGSTIHEKELKKIINKINLLKPDIIFFTGDLINSSSNPGNKEISTIIDQLNKLDSAIELYAVKGNYDYNETYNKIIDETNFVVLNNESQVFYYNDITPIYIVGVEDEIKGSLDIKKAFTNYDETYFTILVTHEPDTFAKVKDYKIDLVLAGHSHNGQFKIPFLGPVIKVPGAKIYYDEKYKINNTEMYISGGLGTSKYPFRFLNPPSINLYRLYNK